MKKQLSLVELAAYGYAPDRVNKGSWLEQKFGNKKGADKDGRTGRSDQDKDKQER